MIKPKDADERQSSSLVAIDPETGDRTEVFLGCRLRARVSPDGRTVAYEKENAIWIGDLGGNTPPKRIIELNGASSGSPPVWSSNGKEIVISAGPRDEEDKRWTFTTLRTNADGSGRTRLEIPEADGVHDWSSDGERLLTVSSPNAEIGWHLYVMRVDGTGTRQVGTSSTLASHPMAAAFFTPTEVPKGGAASGWPISMASKVTGSSARVK